MKALLIVVALPLIGCASTGRSAVEQESCALQADRKAIAAYMVHCTDQGHVEETCPEFDEIDARHEAELKECYGL